ncbi:hypothetical protein J6590_045934 [Homalodisca vitripennis]|nr:hypothetical protein J6590_045934 [Homalodisca vitripennis]
MKCCEELTHQERSLTPPLQGLQLGFRVPLVKPCFVSSHLLGHQVFWAIVIELQKLSKESHKKKNGEVSRQPGTGDDRCSDGLSLSTTGECRCSDG